MLRRAGRAALLIVAVTALTTAACTGGGQQSKSRATEPASPATTAASRTSTPGTSSRTAARSATTSTPRSRASTVATGASKTVPAAPKIDTRTYHNARFGFSVAVPTRLRSEVPPVDGDGLGFSGDHDTVSETVYGGNNVGIGDTARKSLAGCVRRLTAEAGTVTYRFVSGNTYVCSGTKRGRIYYERGVIGPRTYYGLVWTYPAATRRTWDPAVRLTVASFRIGSL